MFFSSCLCVSLRQSILFPSKKCSLFSQRKPANYRYTCMFVGKTFPRPAGVLLFGTKVIQSCLLPSLFWGVRLFGSLSGRGVFLLWRGGRGNLRNCHLSPRLSSPSPPDPGDRGSAWGPRRRPNGGQAPPPDTLDRTGGRGATMGRIFTTHLKYVSNFFPPFFQSPFLWS